METEQCWNKHGYFLSTKTSSERLWKQKQKLAMMEVSDNEFFSHDTRLTCGQLVIWFYSL